MREDDNQSTKWAEGLSRELQGLTMRTSLLERSERFLLVAKARWLFLVFISVYAGGAGIGFTFSDVGWFLSRPQLMGIVIGCLSLFVYNAFYYFTPEKLARYSWSDHCQILLDSLCVTLLILVSGGAGSWIWAVYLLVMFEAAILIENRNQVIAHGLFALGCYGLLLAGEYYSVLPYHDMPFVDPELHHHAFFLALMWLWVAVLVMASAWVSAYLMNVLRQGQLKARASESRLKEFLEDAQDLIFSVTPFGRIVYANHATGNTMGYSREELLHLDLKDVADTDTYQKYMLEIAKASSGEQSDPFETRLINKDREVINVEVTVTCSHQNGAAGVTWLICRDISARKKAQEQLFFLAHHDQLTGLPNRFFLSDQLRKAQALAKRTKNKCAVLYLDLDRFKVINDSLGHAVGDLLLQEVGTRLRDCVRQVDTIARIGGDEFAIVLVNLKEEANAEYVATKIHKAFTTPFLIENQKLSVRTSIGISLFPSHADQPDELMKKADTAMYYAKAKGRNTYQVYDPAMDYDTEHRITLENGMRRALDNDEFRLLYQPKIDVESGQIMALEALLRWEHPDLGTILPNDFIPLAEETGLIVQIGEWVMRRAMLDNRSWQEAGLQKVRVAINVSRIQLHSHGFTTSVKALLEETGLNANDLEFEISEQDVMHKPGLAIEALGRLWDIGIHLSIDKFGSGYASLAHLKGFSVNNLKIDQKFVRDIEKNSTVEAIATAIISMSKSLGIKVTAEGVETEGQFAMLREKECTEMQGYLFSRPVTYDAVTKLLRDGLEKEEDAQTGSS